MYSKKSIALIILLYVFLALCPGKAEAEVNLISLSWSGHISGVTSFRQDAVPSGISQGDLISGSLTFEPGQYSASSYIYGNIVTGYEYRYGDGLEQTINIGLWEWVINGADISLTNSFSYTSQAFDVFSTSEKCSFDSFPNYVGRFEYGFALFDKDTPLNLFDSYQIEGLQLILDEVSEASGFLTTRLWDDNRDVVDGYYITFVIDEISHSPIVPKPASPISHDINKNWIIDDFELLDAIDRWAIDNLYDFELLNMIDYWAYGSYCWEETLEDYKAGLHNESGICKI